MASVFRIHPAFGIARVGDADGSGFIGPEWPGVPANWDFGASAFGKFKEDGRIKRQGVRFRVFEFDEDGSLVGEALSGHGSIAAIEWTVHVANRKAAFFRFDGPNGEDGDFSRNGARNENVVGQDRARLEIEPGPKMVSGILAGPVILNNPNPTTNAVISDLGQISTDEAGRLIFFGGHGRTLQLPGAEEIRSYVNNDGWFDDVCDGSVSAVVILQDGTRVDALGAWVSVGPPDFAPAVANVVSLYDTMWDVVVRHPSIALPDLVMYRQGGALARLRQQRNDWDEQTNTFRTYRPSYVHEILPLFQRALNATFLHDPPDLKKAFHNTIGPQVWADLGDPSPTKARLHADVFKRIRNPTATGPADCTQMPRGLGDEYCDEEANPAGSPARLNPKRFFSLTRVQYALLARWKAGEFEPDGTSLPEIPGTPPPITPEGLDRAGLEIAVGGPFFPGIEVSWLIRNPRIYLEPFRFQVGARIAPGDPNVGIPDVAVRPGFLTQQMAVPWHADFRDCKRESLEHTQNGTETFAMWWAGQRPDDVFPEDDPTSQVPWTRAPHFLAPDTDTRRYKEMVRHWSTLGFAARRDPNDPRRWLETERS
jgi:hypothetical protein